MAYLDDQSAVRLIDDQGNFLIDGPSFSFGGSLQFVEVEWCMACLAYGELLEWLHTEHIIS